MPSTPIAGFITKSDAAEQYQRSHRQLSRDLSDAMKVQVPRVLENCRLHTEDGKDIEGMGVTPEIIDQLCVEGKNPTWYLRTSWLEKTYGRRGGPRRRSQKRSDVFTGDAGEGSDTASRPELVHVLRERIQGLERDKEDLRDEMKIKNQQIADRVDREKETNALIRDLHTLMADLQRRLLLPTHGRLPQSTESFVETQANAPKPARRTDEAAAVEAEVSAPAKAPKKGSRRPGMRRRTTAKKRKKSEPSRRKPATKKRNAVKKKSTANDTSSATKSRSLWSRLFPH